MLALARLFVCFFFFVFYLFFSFVLQCELKELYQLEVEAASCYDDLNEEKQRNRVLEAKIVEICGDEDVVKDVLSAENRRRRLAAISTSSINAENVQRELDTNTQAGREDWINSLPMRFRRELELEKAQGYIKEVSH